MNCLLIELLKRNRGKEKEIKQRFSEFGQNTLISIKSGLAIANDYIKDGIKFIFTGRNWHANSDIGIPINKVDFDGLVGEPMSVGTAMIIASLIGAGGGIAGGLLSKGDEVDTGWGEGELYRQLPDYSEAAGARGGWWNKLQEWGGQEGYGAIPMNWDEIWNQAKNRISRYYWGGVTDPGLAGKMKSQAARLNRPVNETMIGALGQQEKIDLSDLATTQATQKAEYGEKGRQNWLQSMMALASLKPSYVTRTGVAGGGSTYGAGNMIGDISSGIGSLFTQYAKQQQMEDLFTKLSQQQNTSTGTDMFNMPETSQFSMKSGYNDWWNQGMGG